MLTSLESGTVSIHAQVISESMTSKCQGTLVEDAEELRIGG